MAQRVWPLVLGIGLLLSMTTTVLPTLFVVGLVVAFVAGRMSADRVPDRYIIWFVVAATVVVGVLVWFPNGAPKVVVADRGGWSPPIVGAVALPSPPAAAVDRDRSGDGGAGPRQLVEPRPHRLGVGHRAGGRRRGGGRVGDPAGRVSVPVSVTLWLAIAAIPLSVSAVRLLTRAIGWDDWGGMMANVFLAVAGISLCFPLGVLLALGRRAGRSGGTVVGGVIAACILGGPVLLLAVLNGIDLGNTTTKVLLIMTVLLAALGFVAGLRSSLPVLRVLSVRLHRGGPGLPAVRAPARQLRRPSATSSPRASSRPTQVVRAIVVFTFFTAAYIAEIVARRAPVAAEGAGRSGTGARPVAGQDDRG